LRKRVSGNGSLGEARDTPDPPLFRTPRASANVLRSVPIESGADDAIFSRALNLSYQPHLPMRFFRIRESDFLLADRAFLADLTDRQIQRLRFPEGPRPDIRGPFYKGRHPRLWSCGFGAVRRPSWHDPARPRRNLYRLLSSSTNLPCGHHYPDDRVRLDRPTFIRASSSFRIAGRGSDPLGPFR